MGEAQYVSNVSKEYQTPDERKPKRWYQMEAKGVETTGKRFNEFQEKETRVRG